MTSFVPESCTLPTAEQPLRVAQFRAVFAAALRVVDRVAPTRLRLVLDGTGAGTEATVRDLVARETACCSFFTFSLERENGLLRVEVRVPPAQVGILDGLTDLAHGELPAGRAT